MSAIAEQPPIPAPPRAGGRALAWATGVVVVNALTSAGFSLAALLDELSDARFYQGRVLAMYAAARSVPLAAISVWCAFKRRRGGLAVLALVMTFVQAFDALIGLTQSDWGKTVGPAVFALLTAWAARALIKHTV